MTIPAVTPLPAISRTDPGFRAKANAYWLTQVPAWTVECNAQALAVQTESDLVLGYRNAASASATTASNQVTLAANQVTLAANQAGIATAAAQTALNAPGTSGTSTTSIICNGKDSLQAQDQGTSFQSRKTMKSGRSLL